VEIETSRARGALPEMIIIHPSLSPAGAPPMPEIERVAAHPGARTNGLSRGVCALNSIENVCGAREMARSRRERGFARADAASSFIIIY